MRSNTADAFLATVKACPVLGCRCTVRLDACGNVLFLMPSSVYVPLQSPLQLTKSNSPAINWIQRFQVSFQFVIGVVGEALAEADLPAQGL